MEELIKAAKKARLRAYAPYSDWQVGAALKSKEGKIYSGCNIENASYGLSMCAERVALFKAVSEGVTDFEALVLVSDREEPAAPCGACRQVLAEFALTLPVFLVNLQEKVIRTTVEELLPAVFWFKK
ncbi:MAG TPA: cytidine deaminase [Clostridia bacterium]|nr:cytidine deaminase [Clostridia bacterium]